MLLLAAWAVACGPVTVFRPPPKSDGGIVADGGVDAGASSVDGGLPVDQACRVLIDRRCALLTRCGLISADALTQSDCRASFTATWCGPTTWLSRVDSRIATLKYDPLVAQQCADALEARLCPSAGVLPDACGRFLRPNALNKQECYGGYNECVEGTCRGAVCPRMCRARGQVAESCDIDDDCRTGLYCRSSLTSPPVNTCAVPAAVGESCTGARCADGLFCNRVGICVTLPEAGQACVQGHCDAASTCVNDGGLCVERRADGAPCERDGDCRDGSLCLSGNGMSGTCAPVELTAGAVCYPQQHCAEGTVCLGANSSTPGLCRVPLTVGTPCNSTAECEPQLTCMQNEMNAFTCLPRRENGEQCRADRDCQVLSNCLEGLCVRRPTLGEPCLVSVGCQVGTCQSAYQVPTDAGVVDAGSALASGLCVDLLSAGAACRVGADCASGRCEVGYCTAPCQP